MKKCLHNLFRSFLCWCLHTYPSVKRNPSAFVNVDCKKHSCCYTAPPPFYFCNTAGCFWGVGQTKKVNNATKGKNSTFHCTVKETNSKLRFFMINSKINSENADPQSWSKPCETIVCGWYAAAISSLCHGKMQVQQFKNQSSKGSHWRRADICPWFTDLSQ